MKYRYLPVTLLVIALSICTLINAQTTLEEYNYLTKGYKVQIESGLDMKKGYELEDVDSGQTPDQLRTIYVKRLLKINGTQKTTAAYLLIYTKGNNTEYICVPHPKSETDILGMFWETLHNESGNIDSSLKLQFVCYMLTKQLVWK